MHSIPSPKVHESTDKDLAFIYKKTHIIENTHTENLNNKRHILHLYSPPLRLSRSASITRMNHPALHSTTPTLPLFSEHIKDNTRRHHHAFVAVNTWSRLLRRERRGDALFPVIVKSVRVITLSDGVQLRRGGGRGGGGVVSFL